MSRKNQTNDSSVKRYSITCTFGQLMLMSCQLFDLEYVFLQIRSKSVGEIAKLKVLCPDDKETYAEADVDLTKVDVHVDDHTQIKFSWLMRTKRLVY